RRHAPLRNRGTAKVRPVRINVGGPAVPCDLPAQPVPEGTDWEMWLGPAPARGYNEVLCPKGIHNHFPAWRNYREYAGGGLSDMGAHHFDIAQWCLGMDASGPVEVIPPKASKAQTGAKFLYANGVEAIHVSDPSGCVFTGERAALPAHLFAALINSSIAPRWSFSARWPAGVSAYQLTGLRPANSFSTET